jgi:hypothetical protein
MRRRTWQYSVSLPLTAPYGFSILNSSVHAEIKVQHEINRQSNLYLKEFLLCISNFTLYVSAAYGLHQVMYINQLKIALL